MKHLNGHETEVHSVKRTAQGIAFVVRCCGEHEKSVHIQNAHKFAKDLPALKREILRYQREVSEEHEAHLVVEQFVRENVEAGGTCRGCGNQDV